MMKNKKISVLLFAGFCAQLFCPEQSSMDEENKRHLDTSSETEPVLKIERSEQQASPQDYSEQSLKALHKMITRDPDARQKIEKRRLLNEKIETPVDMDGVKIWLQYAADSPYKKRGYIGGLRMRLVDGEDYLGTITFRATEQQIEKIPLSSQDELISYLRRLPVGAVFFADPDLSLIKIHYRLTGDLVISDDGEFKKTNVEVAETFFRQLLLDNGSLKSTFIEDLANFGRFLKTLPQPEAPLTKEDRLSERSIVINPTHKKEGNVYKSFDPEEFYAFISQLNKTQNKSQA